MKKRGPIFWTVFCFLIWAGGLAAVIVYTEAFGAIMYGCFGTIIAIMVWTFGIDEMNVF